MRLGGVACRPAVEVEEEMGELARRDRVILSTPFPRSPRSPGRFFIAQRPPLPPPPKPINPYVPDVPDAVRRVRAAAISARARKETEAYLRPLLEEAASAAAAPREVSPPRKEDDVFDLARWSRRYSRWNQIPRGRGPPWIPPWSTASSKGL